MLSPTSYSIDGLVSYTTYLSGSGDEQAPRTSVRQTSSAVASAPRVRRFFMGSPLHRV